MGGAAALPLRPSPGPNSSRATTAPWATGVRVQPARFAKASATCSVQIVLGFPNRFVFVRYSLIMPQPNNSRRGRPPRQAIYERLGIQIGELRDRLGGLPSPVEAEGIWRGIWLEEAHHSTAIEGNTLVLKQVEQLLAEGRAVGNKELREYMEVRGYADAANWVYGHAIDAGDWSSEELLSLTELRHIHRVALTPVWDV